MESDPLSGVVVFVTAARARTFTHAAEQLGISKSAISKTIAKLEAKLEAKLFHRTTRVTTLTTDGEAYLAACTAAIDEILAAQAALASNNRILSGRLHIDVPVAFGRRVLLPLFMETVRSQPNLGLTLTFTDSTSDLLQEGVDLAIRFGSLPDSGDLIARKLVTQKRIICASPEYLRTYGVPKSLTDLNSHHCIVGTLKGPPTVWLLDNGNGEVRFSPPSTHRMSDGEAIVDAAIGGLGLIQMPASLVRDQLISGRLVQVLDKYSKVDVDVHAVWPRLGHINPRVRFVVQNLITFAEQGRLD